MKFDLVIRKGLIVDGTGSPAFEADLGISGGRISQIGELGKASASETIEADGKIVAPGFIDIHGHSDYFLLIEPGAPNKLRQGVTSEIGGNCGYSAAPISKKLSDERGDSLEKNFGFRPDWLTLAEYYDRLEITRPAINFGIQVGHNTVRASVMGGEAREAEPEEMSAMQRMVREGMADGALGFSTGLVYPPACFADSDELAELCRHATEGFFSTHMRSEGKQLIEAIGEVIDAAKKAGIRLQISHFKTSGPGNWKKIDDAIGLIEDARKEGIDVRCDRYPYLSSFTGLSAVLPSWVLEGTREEYRRRLRIPEVRNRIRRELDFEHPDGKYLERVAIAQTFSEETHRFEGMRVADAARQGGKDPLDFLLNMLASEESDPTAIYHTMNEDNMTRILNLPYSVIGSDSASRAPGPPLGLGKPHPRAYGCFPRFLEIVRDRKIMSIEEAVKKMTGDTAKIAGISDRGILKPGLHADISVFDLDKVADRATYDNPHQYAAGFAAVIVNGIIAVRDDDVTGNRNGHVLRRSV